MFQPETVLIIVKFVGMASAAVFGALGLVHEYKDATGNLTKWGRVAMWGIALAFAVSASAEILQLVQDQQKQRRALDEAVAELNRHAEVVSNLTSISGRLQRSLELGAQTTQDLQRTLEIENATAHELQRQFELVDLNDLRLSFVLKYQASDSFIGSYVDRLQLSIRELEERVKNEQRRIYRYSDERFEFVPDRARDVFRPGLTIMPGSHLWPTESADGNAFRLFRDVLLYLSVSNSAKPSDIGDPANFVGSVSGRLTNGGGGGLSDSCCRLFYLPREKAIMLEVREAKLAIERRRPPAFLSKLDYEDRPVDAVSYSSRPGVELSQVVLHFGRLGSLRINVNGRRSAKGTDETHFFGMTGRSDYRDSVVPRGK